MALFGYGCHRWGADGDETATILLARVSHQTTDSRTEGNVNEIFALLPAYLIFAPNCNPTSCE
jgi:hypothetical protein